ncbi:MAG TPA: hypothetical protein PKD51_05720 [Saprospiraceae bacterium]|nr:hypothetical protein [Saprospiraceae bacterium]
MRTILSLIIFFCTFSSAVFAQVTDEGVKPVDGSILNFGLGIGLNVPLGDMADRYGTNMNFGLSGEYITKNNWLVNAEFLYLFSENIKEDVLAPYRTIDGFILGDDNQYASLIMKEHGFFMGLGIGKLIPINKDSRSGIKVALSGGILQHQIKFSDDRNSIGQVRAGRHIGYDRLTRGFSLKETIAYKHLSQDRRLNFEFALDFIQGFTSEVRAINFDTGLSTNKSRFDMLIGARLMWNLPFYKGSEKTVYY